MQVAVKSIKTLRWFVALIVVMPHVAKVALQSVQIVDHSNDLSLLIVVTVALVINLGNRKQLIFVSNIFILNILKVSFENVEKYSLKVFLTHFKPILHFYIPGNKRARVFLIKKLEFFLMFSGDIQMDCCIEVD